MNDITKKQWYAIGVIEKYYSPYEDLKFEGNTREEATEFISKYYDEAKKGMLVSRSLD